MRKNNLSKTICMLLTCILTFSLIAGCASSGKSDSSSQGSGKKVLFLMTDTNDTFRNTITESIKSQASSQGITLDYVETGGDVDFEIEQITNAASAGYSAIICRPADNSTALQLNIAANGLPLIYVNNQPSDEHLVGDSCIFVGSDERQAGQYQAEYVINRLGKGAMNVIIFEGEKGHSATISRTSAVKDTLKANGVNANYVFVDFADWSDAEAAAKFDIFKKTGQNVDAVFCNNDTMALGAIEALKKYGIDYTKVPVCGVDATADGCASIAAGEMAFTVLQDAENQAAKCVEAAKVLGSGGNLSQIEGASSDHKYIWVDFKPVDSSNVKDYQ